MNFTDPQVKMLDFVVDSDGVFAVQIDAQDITVTQKDGAKSNFLLRQSDCMRRTGRQVVFGIRSDFGSRRCQDRQIRHQSLLPSRSIEGGLIRRPAESRRRTASE
jgi:hypothetical protein